MNRDPITFDSMIESLLTPDQIVIYRRERDAQLAREVELMKQVSNGCADAMAEVAAALRFPRISADALNHAIERLHDALKAARELDQCA